jgi:signal transduction histidine kinase
MWFGTGMGLFRWQEGNIERITGKDFEAGVVRAITEDASGHLWVGRSGGSDLRLGCVEGEQLVPRGADQGLRGHDVFGLHAEPGGALWIATVGDGLWRHQDGVFTRYAAEAGLPDSAVYSIAMDEAGNLWLTSPSGIVRVSQESVSVLSSNGAPELDCLVYNRTDGLPTRECSGGAQPSIWRARNGRLLFAMTEGAVALSPDRVRVNRLPPPVLVEEVRVDGKPIVSEGSLRLEPGRRVVEFHYTAPSLAAPTKVRFRYRLDGVDTGWRDAEASRSAMYSLTSPGEYRFRVIACNNDGVWNLDGAMVGLVIAPYFWQTRWFGVLAPLTLFLVVGGAIRSLERRQVRRKLEQIEMQQMVEKERARIARDIHDELGASLTEIGLLSEFAQRDTAPADRVKADIQQIAGKARGCTRALDEIVWAVNPRNDTLDGFVTYACAYAQEHLRLAGIRCRLEAAMPMPSRSLRADLRHHLFLAFKEALNNVVKHAQASEVDLKMFVEGNRLAVLISDDGRGFDPAAASCGDGLANMKERLESAGGAFQCESRPGSGTRIRLAMGLE